MRFFIVATCLLASATAFEGESKEQIEKEIGERLNLEEYHQKIQEVAAAAHEILKLTDDEKTELEAIRAEMPSYAPPAPDASNDEDIYDINGKSEIKDDLFEGDVILTTEQLEGLRMFNPRNTSISRARRQAQTGPYFPRNQWESLLIPFDFEAGYPSDRIAPIREAAKFWSDNTCVKFREGAAGNDRIKFVSKSGCWSYIGKISNTQEVSIGQGCGSVGTVAHELGHALGLYHTQSRYDRKNYLMVDNTQVDSKDINFVETTNKETDNFGIPYEFNSIMHYGPFDMSGQEGKPVLVANRGYDLFRYSMGARYATFNDVQLINRYYKCVEKKCPGTKTVCQNGGYVDPNACNKCKCPQGYGGDNCSQKPTGCYKEIEVKGQGTLPIQIGTRTDKEQLHFTECTYVLKAPAGRRVAVVIRDLKSYAIRNCYYGGIEVQWQRDATMAGPTFCDEKTPTLQYSFASDDNRITITARDRFIGTSANIQYYLA